jgi:indole-3-glycerol phosphate synthase
VILDEIVKKTKEDLDKRVKEFPLDVLGKSLAYNPYIPRDPKPYLMATPDNPYRLICEVKKASPSKGIIREDFDPYTIATEYESGGADAISVLTEPHFFNGNLDFITGIRRYVKTPLLRKDFIIDKYQIVEALVYGADFVLLIAKILTNNQLKEFVEYSWHLGLDALVEVHDKDDMLKALYAKANIIGINHRNLDDFSMDMELCKKLVPMVPKNKIIVAESGIDNQNTIKELSQVGVSAFLIGEHFMRQKNIKEAVMELKK